LSRRGKDRENESEISVDRRLLSLTILFYVSLFGLIGSAFGYFILYDLFLSGKLGIPLVKFLPHYSFTTSLLLGISLTEIILWPLLLIRPDWF